MAEPKKTRDLRSLLYPESRMADLRTSALVAICGAIIAGCFGILHDQITYTISPEYFTRMKFHQFRGADLGLPPRLFVAQIGVIGTWWVGLIGGWFLGRIAVRRSSMPLRVVLFALGFVVLVAVAFGVSGYFWGVPFSEAVPGWEEEIPALGVTNIEAFQRVAGIHVGSYLGALIGWILAMVRLVKMKRTKDC